MNEQTPQPVQPQRLELVFEPHPEAPGLTVCTLDGCVVGGVGDTKEQALYSFVTLINRLEAGKQMTIQALAVATGKLALPGSRPAEPQPSAPLIIPASAFPRR